MTSSDWFVRRSRIGLKHVIRPMTFVVVCLAAAASCGDVERPTEPGATPKNVAATAIFTGTWAGVRRVVSCSPAGEACAPYPPGEERYFAASFNQQGEDVDGSVILSEPGPLALPYGFPVRGRVAASGQLSFDRLLFDEREPRFSGALTVKASFPPELVGRMTENESISFGRPITLVWDVAAARPSRQVP